MSTRLNNDATNTDDRLCFGFTEDAIKLAIGADVKQKSQREMTNLTQLKCTTLWLLELLEWKN